MSPRSLLILAAGSLLAPIAFAAPVPSDSKTGASPVLTVQLKSAEHWRWTLQTLGKNFLADQQYASFEREFLSKFDAQNLKGIDTKKPAGLYGSIGTGLLKGDFSKSSIVFLVPIVNEQDFLDSLGDINWFGNRIKPEKRGENWALPIPEAPFEATIWFRKSYAYICLATEKIDPKTLLDPKEAISDKEKSAFVMHLRVDLLPKDFGTESVALLAFGAEEAQVNMQKYGVPAEVQEGVGHAFRLGSKWLKSITGEVKEVTVRADIDPKTGVMMIDKFVEAKSGSALANSFAALKPTKNDFADIVGPDSAAHIMVQAPLFVDDVRDSLVRFADLGAVLAEKELARNEPKELVDLATESLHALSRTLKTGHMDFAASLRGPDKNDQFTAVGALSVKDPAAFEKALKAGLKAAPKNVCDMFKFDAFKVGEINVHEIAVADELPPDAQKIFGKSSVYFAFTPNAGFAAFGGQGKDAIKELITAKHEPKPAPLASMTLSGKRLAALMKTGNARMDGQGGRIFEMLNKTDRIPYFSVKVEGGDRLVVRSEFTLVQMLLDFR